MGKVAYLTRTPAQQVEAILAQVESMLSDTLTTLHGEASVLSADMEALLGRLSLKGHIAKVDDLKAGKWYRTASDLRLLQALYTFVCDVTGTKERIVNVPTADENDSSPGVSKGDQDKVDE